MLKSSIMAKLILGLTYNFPWEDPERKYNCNSFLVLDITTIRQMVSDFS